MTAAIHVCPLSAIEKSIAAHRPTHLVTLINRELMIATPEGIAPENHLKLDMHDIAAPIDGYVAPCGEHVSNLLRFAQGWDRKAPMLIHCWAGISRSTAAAYVSLCALNPRASELALAQRLRRAAPEATPNRLIVALADRALGREGRMVAAVEAIGRGQMALSGRPFFLPSVCD